MEPILLSIAGNPENQDRGIVLREGDRTILCVADGAGGMTGGAEAAIMAIEFVRQNAPQLNSMEACAEVLRKMDAAVADDRDAGETTCALAVVTAEEVFGGSVGDSGAWLIRKSDFLNLSQGQQRKPLIGSGSAWPVPFKCGREPGATLLLATDGLLKYTSSERILAICREQAGEATTRKLIELVCYPSGALPDDVTVVLATL